MAGRTTTLATLATVAEAAVPHPEQPAEVEVQQQLKEAHCNPTALCDKWEEKQTKLQTQCKKWLWLKSQVPQAGGRQMSNVFLASLSNLEWENTLVLTHYQWLYQLLVQGKCIGENLHRDSGIRKKFFLNLYKKWRCICEENNIRTLLSSRINSEMWSLTSRLTLICFSTMILWEKKGTGKVVMETQKWPLGGRREYIYNYIKISIYIFLCTNTILYRNILTS